jgi:hypothetical protein
LKPGKKSWPDPSTGKSRSAIDLCHKRLAFSYGQDGYKDKSFKKSGKKNKACIVYANLVGGQDELVFDGRSVFIDCKGKVLASAKAFKEDLCIFDIDSKELVKKKVNNNVNSNFLN